MRAARVTAQAVRVAACAVLFSTAACLGRDRAPLDEGPPVIVLHADTSAAEYGAVDVAPLDAGTLAEFERSVRRPEDWQRIFALYTTPPDSAALAVLGSYTVRGGTLRFTPRYPPVPGLPYHARFNAPALRAGAAVLDTVLLLPRRTGEPAEVAAIYPSADRLPMNLLRLYVQFSAPMSVGEAYRRIRLLDENGRAVKDAFLVVAGDRELWDRERRRLTLLFDPGRIKRDLRPNQELGLPLRAGKTFTLVVDSSWQDANGQPLRRAFRKHFSVHEADRAAPRTADWQIEAPAAGGRAALTLTFPEPLDRALLLRLLVVKGPDGRELRGTVTVPAPETSWTFTPELPWRAGTFAIEVNSDLEDLAGNNLRGLFDVDRSAPAPAETTKDRVTIPFAVR